MCAGGTACVAATLSGLSASKARTTSARLTRPGDLTTAIAAAIVAVGQGDGEYPGNPEELEVPGAIVGSIAEKSLKVFIAPGAQIFGSVANLANSAALVFEFGIRSRRFLISINRYDTDIA